MQQHILEANCTNCGHIVEFTADCSVGQQGERHNINKMLWSDLQRFLWADPVNCGKCGWLVYIEREPMTRASYSQFIGGF